MIAGARRRAAPGGGFPTATLSPPGICAPSGRKATYRYGRAQAWSLPKPASFTFPPRRPYAFTWRNAHVSLTFSLHGCPPGRRTSTLQAIEAKKPAPFRYHAPKTVEEAVAILAEVAPEDGRVLAGGQSLVPTMAFRLARPPHLVDINGVDSLGRLAGEDGKLCIGACVRHATFWETVVDGPLGRLLASVVRHIGHYPIRT